MSVHVVDSNATAGSGLQTEHATITMPYKAASAITARQVVSIDTSGNVAESATDGTAVLVVGIAPEAIDSGDTGQVVRGGVVKDVPCDGSVSAGDILIRSTSTKGSVAASATPAQGEALGVAIKNSASNVTDVDVRCLGVQDT